MSNSAGVPSLRVELLESREELFHPHSFSWNTRVWAWCALTIKHNLSPKKMMEIQVLHFQSCTCLNVQYNVVFLHIRWCRRTVGILQFQQLGPTKQKLLTHVSEKGCVPPVKDISVSFMSAGNSLSFQCPCPWFRRELYLNDNALMGLSLSLPWNKHDRVMGMETCMKAPPAAPSPFHTYQSVLFRH